MININDLPIKGNLSDLSESEESIVDSTIKINNKSKNDSVSKKSKKSKTEEIDCSSISSISEQSSFNFLDNKNEDIVEIIKILGKEKDIENEEIIEITKELTNYGKKSKELKDDKLHFTKTEYTTNKILKEKKKLKEKSNEKTFLKKKRKYKKKIYK